jgi:hypothetical protein
MDWQGQKRRLAGAEAHEGADPGASSSRFPQIDLIPSAMSFRSSGSRCIFVNFSYICYIWYVFISVRVRAC